ncbi:MAG: hypothetical protein U1E70_13085 [Acetobacteraceae bacterium]
MFDTIWNGRIVSEAALSSRINAARKAIGDDGDRQALIKTIHRRGFRFVGTVEDRVVRSVTASMQPGQRSQAPVAAGIDTTRKPSIAVLPFHESQPGA